MEEKLTCHLCNSPLNLDDYDLAKKYIAAMVNDKVYIGSYNNWGFQGIIPAHLRELFTPNGIIGIILTPEQLDDLLNRKSFTAADLKILMNNCNKSE